MNISPDFRSTPSELFRRWRATLLLWSWFSALLHGNSIGALARSTVHDKNDDTLYRRGASFTDQVSFDNYHLSLHGQRIFLQSVSSIRFECLILMIMQFWGIPHILVTCPVFVARHPAKGQSIRSECCQSLCSHGSPQPIARSRGL